MTLPADWPDAWRERYEERAAIMEYDGGLTRAVAERLAFCAVRDQFEAENAADARVLRPGASL